MSDTETGNDLPSSSSLSSSLTVSKCPSNNLAYTNFVYVHPKKLERWSAQAKKECYVKICNRIFIAQSHPSIGINEIGLNALQRKSMDISVANSIVEVDCWHLPKRISSIYCIRMQLVIDIAAKRNVTISETKLIKFLKTHFQRHVFSQNQEFSIDFNGATLLLSVKKLYNVSNPFGQETTLTTQCAMLTEYTAISVETSFSSFAKYLTLERDNRDNNQDNAQGLLDPRWKFEDMGIGGLDAEFSKIFRRAFASRLLPSDVIDELGIKHVKGLLLYGPPGTGKTLIARQIAKMLQNGNNVPKIVNGPEILNKYIGQSEEAIRKLFVDAEEEYKKKGNRSSLHVIIFDEIDAICKSRGSDASGTGVYDTIVNQLLTKLDGIDTPNNFLVIGMTNRIDILDPALLRPGRLELHIQIGLPDEAGRQQILAIHTRKMKDNGRLGKDVNLEAIASCTKNFSGAELEGLVKSAASFVLSSHLEVNEKNRNRDGDSIRSIQVTQAHFDAAALEVKSSFGASDDILSPLLQQGLFLYDETCTQLLETGELLLKQLQTSNKTSLTTLLLKGASGSGKTALAAYLAQQSKFPFLRIVRPETLIGKSETAKCNEIRNVFEDAYKSPLSIIILDDIERLIEYVSIGPRFSNSVLQCLLVLLKRKLDLNNNSKLMVIGTTSQGDALEQMGVSSSFQVSLEVPELTTFEQVQSMLQQMNYEENVDETLLEPYLPIPIKKLLMAVDIAFGNTNTTLYDGLRIVTQ